MTAHDEVRAVNEAFYRAHEDRELDAMASVWAHDDRVVCVHPGWPILRGWDDVRESWRRIFEGPGRNQFVMTNLSVDVGSELARMTMEENLVGRDGMIAISATNIYARTDGVWLMVAHHASAIMPTLG